MATTMKSLPSPCLAPAMILGAVLLGGCGGGDAIPQPATPAKTASIGPGSGRLFGVTFLTPR
jgi:hypothetical protein